MPAAGVSMKAAPLKTPPRRAGSGKREKGRTTRRGESDDDVERHLDRECDERDDVDCDDNDHDSKTAWREAVLNSRSCWSRAADGLLAPKPAPVTGAHERDRSVQSSDPIVEPSVPKGRVVRIVFWERYPGSARASVAPAAFSL